LETVLDEGMWVYQLFMGCLGRLNDVNVMYQSPMYLEIESGAWPPRNVSYTVNGTTRHLPYNLLDGIYPRFAISIPPTHSPSPKSS